MSASPRSNFLAIGGQSGLIVSNISTVLASETVLRKDDAECLDLQWSSKGTFLAFIRREQ